jgi:hypothetical protein
MAEEVKTETRYVYKEVGGRELEQFTEDGWELVQERGELTPFGFRSAYLVKRLHPIPTEISLKQEIEKLKNELAHTKTQVTYAKERREEVVKEMKNLWHFVEKPAKEWPRDKLHNEIVNACRRSGIYDNKL